MQPGQDQRPGDSTRTEHHPGEQFQWRTAIRPENRRYREGIPGLGQFVGRKGNKRQQDRGDENSDRGQSVGVSKPERRRLVIGIERQDFSVVHDRGLQPGQPRVTDEPGKPVDFPSIRKIRAARISSKRFESGTVAILELLAAPARAGLITADLGGFTSYCHLRKLDLTLTAGRLCGGL